jgi:tRNA modification GTPase
MTIHSSPPAEQRLPVCSLLTAAGRGAVAVVALSGDRDALVVAIDKLFKPIGSRAFKNLFRQVIVYGQWRSTREDLVVCTTPAGFEIQCHGGNVASAAIMNDLQDLGFDALPPLDWRRHSSSQWRLETENALCQATTERTADLLLRNLKIQEAALQRVLDSTDPAARELAAAKMLEWASFGRHLTQSRSVVFCGQPNVGKSSLVNAIAGFNRTIVNEKAGTTRDVITQATAIDGWPVLLTDTAGLRATDAQIEKIGIEKAEAAIVEADLRIAVFDATEPFVEYDRDMLVTLKADLVVFNKVDLAIDFRLPTVSGDTPALQASAVDRTGLAELVQTIANVLVPELPPANQWYPVTANQERMLQSLIGKPL